jgi:chemotaxis protein histidine kinase CheA
MSGSDLLAAFSVESDEHLDAIEPVLLRAEWEEPSPADVNLLFRAVHSLKGLARVIGQAGMEALAHEAESLLALVRDRTRPLDQAAQSVLLAACDALRAQRERALAGDRPAAPAELIGQLRAAASGGQPGPAGIEAATGPWTLLNPDRDMLVAMVELIDELLPELNDAVAAGNAEARDDLRGLLASAARRLDLPGVEAAARASDPGLLLAMRDRLAALCDVAAAESASVAHDLEDSLAELAASRKLDPARLAGLPPEARQALVGQPWTEVLLDPTEPAALLGLAPALAEPAIWDGRPCLVLLLPAGGNARPAAEAAGKVLAVTPLDGSAPPLRLGLPAPQPSATAASGALDDVQVRVPVGVLDQLFGRIGSFFGASARLNVLVFDSDAPEALRRLGDYAATRAPALAPDVQKLLRQQNELAGIEADIYRLVSHIHDATLGLRVVPLDAICTRFPRLVRDTAAALDKAVRLTIDTGGIKLDKGMVELLADPLTHILRNAVDHGIEPPEDRVAAGKPRTGQLRLAAEQSGNRLTIRVSDDGRGIDTGRVLRKALDAGLVTEAESRSLSPARIARFIFAPGFSTTDAVTETSGRGVGMDVVLVNVTRLGGRIEIDSQPGRGSVFEIDLPLTAAVQPTLLAHTGHQLVAFPEAVIKEVVVLPADEVQCVNGQRAMLLRGHFLPLFRLSDLLDLPRHPDSGTDLPVVVCAHAGTRIGVQVHRVLRRHELLIREAHPRLARLPGMGGVATLGVDRIVLVVDPDGLFDLARRAGTTGLRTAPARLAAGAPERPAAEARA